MVRLTTCNKSEQFWLHTKQDAAAYFSSPLEMHSNYNLISNCSNVATKHATMLSLRTGQRVVEKNPRVAGQIER